MPVPPPTPFAPQPAIYHYRVEFTAPCPCGRDATWDARIGPGQVGPTYTTDCQCGRAA